MKNFVSVPGALLLFFVLQGCGTNPNKTYDTSLLDDKVTNERVQAALKNAGAEYSQVQAKTTNGVIILSGTVQNFELRIRAEDIARSTHRGKDVQDQIEVVK